MRLPRLRALRPIAVTLALLSCTENGPVGPRLDASGHRLDLNSVLPVRFSEFHYDNAGTDADEAIEISGPAGVDVSGWQIVLYNGSTGAFYNTKTLTGTIPATCGARGVIVTTYPTNGIQNGDPDGMALIDGAGHVVEFLSYEGVFAAVGGPADGLTSRDIFASEQNAGPSTQSLQRDASDVWSGPSANTFGACNDDGVAVPVPDVVRADVTPSDATIFVGSTQTYAAAGYDADDQQINAATFTWTSSADAIATVSSGGVVTGVATGDAVITATAPSGVSATANVHVDPAPPPSPGDVVISQIYGAGGNNGALFKNDYVEIFNHGSQAVSLTGWAIQYAAKAGASWAVTPLSGTIQPGQYFLVQEAAGSGSAAALPTPDVTGGINMAGDAGKVILTRTLPARSDACPVDADIADHVGFGTASNCSATWNGTTGTLSATLAAFRRADGCTNTSNNGFDFTTLAPAPRNSSAPRKNCVAALLPAVHFSELHYDNVGTDAGEAIEIAGPAGTDLTGWSVVLYGGDAVPDFSAYSTTPLSGQIPAVCGANGVVVLNYGVNGIKNAKFSGTGNPAGLALVNSAGQVVEFLSYEGTFTALDGPAAGKASEDIGVSEDPAPALGNSLHRDDTGAWHSPSTQDFGSCNVFSSVPTNGITFSGRLPTDPALPVGFEDQLFATLHLASGGTASTTFTWTAVTPAIATIDSHGVMHALSEGVAVFRATAADGTTTTYSLPTVENTFSSSADWSGNLEFGTPSGHAQSGDLLITHNQFTSSFNKTRNIPNWVSAKLDASHYGTGADRCDCFTYDPIVADSGGTPYTTDLYTGEGSVWNRGHLLRSADVESSAGDNSIAYLFTNIAPQSAQMNQGPWAQEENFLGDLAHTGGKDVYEVIGVSGVSATEPRLVKANVTVPAYFWKVAVIVPHGRKLADIRDYGDLQIISVVMPNVASVNSDWTTYKVTVDSVEALSGYDLLNALPDDIEPVVESNDQIPTALLTGPDVGVEGASLAFSGNGSSDPDAGDVLSYSWDFGDNTTATGINPSHTFADNGQYIVTLTVRDQIGAKNVTTKVVTISNAAPSVVVDASAPIVSGTTFALAGGFADPGQIDGPWAYTVNWGDGSSSGTTGVQGAITASHQYFVTGTYTVTLTVTDKDGGVGSNSITLQVNPVASTMNVTQSQINTSNNGNGIVKVTVLGNSSFSASNIVLSTVRIGNVHPATEGNGSYKIQIADVNRDGVADMVAQFVRGDLAADGDLDGSQLTLKATLTDGRQIQSVANISVK